MSAGAASVLDGVPLIELHCHLDCCVRLGTLEELSHRRGIRLEAPVADLAIAPARPTSLVDYLRAIEVALDVMQTGDELARITGELVEDWCADGLIHGEVRFAPQLHTRGGLTVDDAVDAVAGALDRGASARGLSASLIVCCLRHQDPAVSDTIADLAIRRRDVVSAIDLAGPEAGNPGHRHRSAFERARAAGVPITVHAGEAAGPASVREAIDLLGARRVGHGVRSIADGRLVADLARRRIALECCPTSNIQTGAVTSLEAHPIERLRRRGVRVTVSTDGRTTSDTTVRRELRSMVDLHDWDRGHVVDLQLAAAEAAFVDGARRAELIDRVLRQR